MKKKVAVIPGDGIGPEVTAEALKVLYAVGEKFGHGFEIEELLAGGAAIDACGECLPEATLQCCRAADAVLLGAVGGPKWDSLPGAERPERALLGLRAELGLFCNLRPVRVWKALKKASPLKAELLGDGFELLIVRELTGGVYFGAHERVDAGGTARDTMSYSRAEVERVARIAFGAAQTRRGKVSSVDKANVLETSRLWRETVERVAGEFPSVELEHLYVDNAAMQLVRAPQRFDVLLTENMFGDILSDEASQLAGSIGVLPSASLRSDGFGMYEPIHGSAPDIAGRGLANPLAAILSVALMLEHSFGLEREARAIERAAGETLDGGTRSADIADGGAYACTSRIGDEVVRHILNSSL